MSRSARSVHIVDEVRDPSSVRSQSAFVTYVARIRDFDRTDWLVYVTWVGMMLGLVGVLTWFLLVGRAAGAPWPREAYLVPGGAAVFAIAIAIDTIGHRTIYKEILRQNGERLVHHVTIGFGVSSCVLLVLAYSDRVFAIPALVLTVLSLVYSLIDEAFHWKRYSSGKSDVVEMWSHAGILTGHITMMAAWWWCYELGYPGVRETLTALGASS